MSILSDLFKGIPLKNTGYNFNIVGPSIASSGLNFSPSTRQLPNDSGSYQSPVPNQSFAPTTNPAPTPPPPPVVPPPQKKPIFNNPAPVVTPPAGPTLDYSKYTNPATGQPYSPQEYADLIASRQGGGTIPGYAGGVLTNPNMSEADLALQARGLNNARNDIGTGATDPYGIGATSGIAYTPAQLSAIEKAYAGVYDPAIDDVFTKIDQKQKEAANALQMKNDLEKIKQQNINDMAKIDKQHQYAMAEKSAPTYADTHAAGLGLTGGYVPGANPAVDAWAQGIVDGSRKITDIPASQKGMRDAVQLAVVSGGNQLNGKPTTTELGKAALVNAKALMTKVDAGTGTSAVGSSRLWGAGAIRGAVPGSPAYGFSNDFNAIKSQLSLEAVKYLKGQGQVSDAERALLAQAATKLNLSQSESEFKTTLQSIINKLETGNSEGTSTGGSSQPQTMVLNGQTLTLQADGTYE